MRAFAARSKKMPSLALMFRALKGETWRVPFVADVAERIVGR